MLADLAEELAGGLGGEAGDVADILGVDDDAGRDVHEDWVEVEVERLRGLELRFRC